ncbi:sigma-70 family RNA polymerase sigma factor [Lapillicoccus sp.]|uniref:RNA polymerase sigma factor n=1 Tax=Lapillicoccus sp. TaxID=1909287 RepID=UPI0032656670
MTPTADPGAGHAALARLVRDEGSRVLATLVRTTGSLELAEDAVQDAVIRALDVWSREGVPVEPRAWLTLTARRRAIDLLRRERVREGKEAATAALLDLLDPECPEDRSPEDGVLRDDLLRLLFTCCHPALSTQAQIALALRTLCGLTTAEVASALLVSEPTMAKRLTRVRRKIATAGIPYRVPNADDLPERLDGVLATVYLLFNEGYYASAGATPMRRQLTAEAIRLAALLRELLPDQMPVIGLEALLRLHDARSPARLDAAGDPVLLADQDRSRWDRGEIQRGLSLLGIALRLSTTRPDPYVVQAAIAACHDLAPTWDATNWAAIVSWYDVLLAVHDTPVVRLNRAIAVAELTGPAAGLAEIDAIGDLEDVRGYLPLVAARAELLARAGRTDEARTQFRAALATSGNDATKRELSHRLSQLLDAPPEG